VEPEEKSMDRQRLSKEVSDERDTQATIKELLGTMLYIRSVQSGCKEDFS
jgi:hypothetical protein